MRPDLPTGPDLPRVRAFPRGRARPRGPRRRYPAPSGGRQVDRPFRT